MNFFDARTDRAHRTHRARFLQKLRSISVSSS
jgi:hypothetical protein